RSDHVAPLFGATRMSVTSIPTTIAPPRPGRAARVKAHAKAVANGTTKKKRRRGKFVGRNIKAARDLTDPALRIGEHGRLLRLQEICRLTGLHRSSVWRMIRTGKFPKPLMLMKNHPRWRETDVCRHLERLHEESLAVAVA